MKRNVIWLLAVAWSVLFSCCNEAVDKDRISKNSVYHWKSVFAPSDYEYDFLKMHNIGRLYMKMFDVVIGKIPSSSGEATGAIPIATTVFRQPVPAGIEVVPVVYVTTDVLGIIDGKEKDCAEKIVTRCLAMTDYNDLGKPEEIQVDCDWTSSNRTVFFKLCSEMRELLNPDSIKLSCTIRLHQLSDKDCPPVDRGMLMLYNTGVIRDIDTKNSIISYDDILPYIKKAGRYKLPLDFVYPNFDWNVFFTSDSIYEGLDKSKINLGDKSCYESFSDNTYRVIADRVDVGSTVLFEGQFVRHEDCDIEEILKVKRLVEGRLGRSGYSSAIYHLDSADIYKFKDYEIDEIFKTR